MYFHGQKTTGHSEVISFPEPHASKADDDGCNIALKVNGECTISLWHLRHLELCDPGDARVNFDIMTAPRLEVFHIAGGSRQTGDSIHKFMQRSRPPLTSLHIVGAFFDEETLIKVLSLLHTLKDLRLKGLGLSARLFEELTAFEDHTTRRIIRSPNGEIICPELQILQLFEVNVAGDRNMCLNALVSMIKSRYLILKTFQTISYVYRSAHTLPISSPKLDTHRHRLNILRNLVSGCLRIEGDAAH